MREMGEGTAKSKKTTAATELEHHGASYLRMLMGALSGAALSCGLTDSLESLSSCLDPYRTGSVSIRSPKLRYSVTMAGHARMESLMQLIKQVATHGPSGSYVEAGVWRGGMSILATAALNVFGQGHRPVYVCDCLRGCRDHAKARRVRPRHSTTMSASSRWSCPWARSASSVTLTSLACRAPQ